MGWLKEAVKKREGKELSHQATAQRMLKVRGWPKSVKLTSESLAVYLGKLDKKQGAEVLATHPALRRFLLDYLEMDGEELDAVLTGSEALGADDTHFQLWDAGTRVLDLRKDSLPPVFPEAVLDSRQWPLLWQAPSGSLRTLVGRWLSVRKSVVFIKAQTWEQAQRQLPQRGGLCFIVLRSDENLPEVDELPPNLSVCLVVDARPKKAAYPGDPWPLLEVGASRRAAMEMGGSGGHWKVVKPLPVTQWIEPLVYWVEAHLQRDSPEDSGVGFDARACLDWLQRDIIPEGFIDSVGVAVGFIGVYATYSHRAYRKGSEGTAGRLVDLARSFVRQRRRGAGEEVQVLDVRTLWEHLQRLAHALLLHSPFSWEESQPLAEWQGLVPGPESFERIRVLQGMLLLREQGPGLHGLRPRWVFSVLLQQAAAELLSRSPEEWGAAVLHEHGAPWIFSSLRERIRAGDFSSLERLLSSWNAQSLKSVAALEVAFVALGWGWLRGDEIPPELAEKVFQRQLEVVIKRHGVPWRSIEHDLVEGEVLLWPEAWLLAAHVLSERLEFAREKVPFALNPWTSMSHDASAERLVFSGIDRVVGSNSVDDDTRLAIFKMYGRLFKRRPRTGQPHSVELLEYIVSGVDEGELDWSVVNDASLMSHALPLLRKYVESQGRSWPSFAPGIWSTWLASPSQTAQVMRLDEPWAPDWFEFITPKAMQHPLVGSSLGNERVPHERFTEEQWNAFLEYWKGPKQWGFSRRSMAAWRRMPPKVIRNAILGDVLSVYDNSVPEEIWKTHPQATLDALSELLSQGRWESAVPLVYTAPAELSEEIIKLIQKHRHSPGFPLPEVIGLLRFRIGRRNPGWEEAWALLRQLAPDGAG
ncbi:hypothetical protein HMI51_20050 [Corallococcus coralloides]|nr:hypothetical protein [Corallococcus coralloides]